MSSHWRSSRWSSAREREDAERTRQGATTTPHPSSNRSRRTTTPSPPTTTAAPASDIGSLIAASRNRTRARKWPYPDDTTTPPPTPSPAPSRRRSVSSSSPGRRTTTPRPATVAGNRGGGNGGGNSGDPGLPPLLDEPTRDGGGNGGLPPRMVILGAALFAIIAFFIVNPGDIVPGLGGDDADPTPTTESMIVPTSVNTRAPDAAVPEATEPAGGSTSNAGTRPEVVCLDAGHGGWDPGFYRQANEFAPFLEEADINLAMSYMLKTRLEAEGFTVVLTRPSGAAVNIFNQDINGDGRVAQDVGPDADDQDGNRDELQARINICNEANADILVSMHINGAGEEAARGYEVIYTAEREFGQQNLDLAFSIYDAMTAGFADVGFDIPGRDAWADSSRGDDTVMHEGRVEDHYIMTGPAVNASDFSIVPSAMPGVIAECAFISNDTDAAFLADPANQQVIVDAYAKGILTYFDRYPGSFEG